VLAAVELNNELGRASYEVANEWADWHLTVEANATQLAIADVLP
jgi:hypothetical protein